MEVEILHNWGLVKSLDQNPQKIRVEIVWKPPQSGWISIYFDYYSKGNLGWAGAAGVVRNHGGRILLIIA